MYARAHNACVRTYKNFKSKYKTKGTRSKVPAVLEFPMSKCRRPPDTGTYCPFCAKIYKILQKVFDNK